MSRIRSVKPEFWTSEQVITCSPIARLLFIGLWNFCDDAGIHPASFVRLKAEIFPADNFTIDEIKKLINELIQQELLREYSVEGKSYWIVTGWRQHQRIDKPTYRHPLPQSDLKKIQDNSSNDQQSLLEHSKSSSLAIDDSSTYFHRIVGDVSLTESNGTEGKGGEKDICEVANSTSPGITVQTTDIFDYWRNVMCHPRSKLDVKRASKIKQALNLGYTVEDLKQAIDGCSKTPFNMGENDKHQRYDDIELILRDATHIDRFISNASNNSSTATFNSPSNNLMLGVI